MTNERKKDERWKTVSSNYREFKIKTTQLSYIKLRIKYRSIVVSN